MKLPADFEHDVDKNGNMVLTDIEMADWKRRIRQAIAEAKTPERRRKLEEQLSDLMTRDES